MIKRDPRVRIVKGRFYKYCRNHFSPPNLSDFLPNLELWMYKLQITWKITGRYHVNHLDHGYGIEISLKLPVTPIEREKKNHWCEIGEYSICRNLKLVSIYVSQHGNNIQVSTDCWSLICLSWSYNSQVTLACLLHTEKSGKAVLPIVFNIIFPASPFRPTPGHKQIFFTKYFLRTGNPRYLRKKPKY